MPQRAFWAQSHETSFHLSYTMNHTAPSFGPTMGLAVYDQARETVAHRNLILPPTLAEEAFLDIGTIVAQSWFLCDAEAAVRAFQRHHRAWVKAAEEQAATR